MSEEVETTVQDIEDYMTWLQNIISDINGRIL
jgi:hypothetical protein